jgi:hypothetical protein
METLEILVDTPQELHLKSTYRPTWQAWRVLPGNERYSRLQIDSQTMTPADYLPVIGASITAVVYCASLGQGVLDLLTTNLLAGILAVPVFIAVGIGLVSGVALLIIMILNRAYYRRFWRTPKVYTIRLDRQQAVLHCAWEGNGYKSGHTYDLSQVTQIEDTGVSTLRLHMPGTKPDKTYLEIEAPQLRRKVYEAITALLA